MSVPMDIVQPQLYIAVFEDEYIPRNTAEYVRYLRIATQVDQIIAATYWYQKYQRLSDD